MTMKKKTDTSPQTNAVCIETESIICGSCSLERGSAPDDEDVQEEYLPAKDADGFWLAE